MSDVDLLSNAFESGELLRPSANTLNIVDLSNALASILGVPNVMLSEGANRVNEMIGSPDHLVFVVSDGFGMHFVESMQRGAFLRYHVASEILTVFPSTTPVVLTSLTTGLWPSRHAITGWDVYLPEIRDISTIIRFHRRSDEVPLSNLSVTLSEAYPVESMFDHVKTPAITLLPDYISRTPFSSYSSGNSEQVGYKELEHAVELILKRITGASGGKTYTYLYTPLVDSNAHEFGTTHRNTEACVWKVNRNLQHLASKLPGNARLVMTADHGLVDSSPNEIHMIHKSDDLLAYLDNEPFGDGRAMYFSVSEGSIPAFRQRFKDRFNEQFALLTVEEMSEMSLLGPDPLVDSTRSRMGNMIAIPLGSDRLVHPFGLKKGKKIPVGSHGGLTPDELRIPLVVV